MQFLLGIPYGPLPSSQSDQGKQVHPTTHSSINIELNDLSNRPSLSFRGLPLPSLALLAWLLRSWAITLGHHDDPFSLISQHLTVSPVPLPQALHWFPPLLSHANLHDTGLVLSRFLLTLAQTPCTHSLLAQGPVWGWIYLQVCPRPIDGVSNFTPRTCVWIHSLEERKLPVTPAPLFGHIGSSCVRMLFLVAKQGTLGFAQLW